MELEGVVLTDRLETAERIRAQARPKDGADASALSESELQLASAMITVNSPLPFRLQPELR